MSDKPDIPTRDLIVEKATALFRDKGYYATSLQDIADASGILKGSLYYYFPSKEAILENVITPGASLPELEAIAAAPQPVEERLRNIIGYIVANNLDSQDKFWVLLHDMRHLSPETYGVCRRSLRSRRKIVEKLIAEGVEAGVFGWENPAFIALNLVQMIDSIALWYSGGGSFGSAEIADGIADFVFKGLLPRDHIDSQRQIK